MYGREGERVEASDVLDDQELAEYAASRRASAVTPMPRPKTVGLRVDEYGYDQHGGYHPEYDGGVA